MHNIPDVIPISLAYEQKLTLVTLYSVLVGRTRRLGCASTVPWGGGV
jgi:hypothetical protein